MLPSTGDGPHRAVHAPGLRVARSRSQQGITTRQRLVSAVGSAGLIADIKAAHEEYLAAASPRVRYLARRPVPRGGTPSWPRPQAHELRVHFFAFNDPDAAMHGWSRKSLPRLPSRQLTRRARRPYPPPRMGAEARRGGDGCCRTRKRIAQFQSRRWPSARHTRLPGGLAMPKTRRVDKPWSAPGTPDPSIPKRRPRPSR